MSTDFEDTPYYEPETKKQWVIESWLEQGAFVWSLKEHLDSGNTRMAVYRNRDSALAAKAAEMLFHFVKKQADEKHPFPYDFTMDVKDHSKAFCSELVTMAYEWSSHGTIQVPTYMSQIRPGIQNFVENVGIKNAPTFIPADLDVDPRFDLVLEWRDIDNMHLTHQQEMILDSIFQWMAEDDYKLHYSLKGSFGYLIQPSTTWPMVGPLTQMLIPPNTTKKMVGTFATLQAIVLPMVDYLSEENQRQLQATGYHLTPYQMMLSLDDYRFKDLLAYKQHKPYSLHRYFRPPFIAHSP